MKNTVSDRIEYIESSDSDDAGDEEEQVKVSADGNDGESDDSDSSSADSPRRSRPSSYTTTWPQSYREMKNTVSDRIEYIESSDSDDAGDEEEQVKVSADGNDGESDDSDSSSADSPRRSRPSSYTTTWPQSYREMKNTVSDRIEYIESSDSDDAGDEEEQVKVSADGNDGESDDSDSSSADSPRRSRPSSYTTTWPQSYRQSIDIYSSVTPPTIGFLGTPTTLSRLGSSFLASSFRGRHTPDAISSLLKPFFPTPPPAPADEEQQQQQQQRKSSHALLPPQIPTRGRPSHRKDHRLSKASSGDLPATVRHCSYAQSVFNGVNVLCGVGMLSAPYSIKEGGWLGLLILIIFGVLAFYTGILLRRCLESEPGLETYPDIGQAAFGTYGRIIVSIILYLELYACCVEYIILDSDNLSSLFPNAHLDIGGIHLNSHLLFAVLITLIVLPSTWVRDFSIISYISAGGVIASVLVVACLFWLGLVDNIGYKNEGSLINLSGISIAIGLYGYSYSGHAVFPNIYSSLKKKSEFPAVLFTSFAISTLLFAGVAVMGSMLFGDATQSQFTLNMPHEFVVSKIAVWTTVVNPITKYSLTLAPMALSLEELMPKDQQKSHWYSIVIRTALTISTLLVAMSVPFFGLVMALVGSSLTMLLALILPCICFLSIAREESNLG